MIIVKRSSAFLCAVALCFSFVMGSLSFMPRSFAVDDFTFPFTQSEIPSVFTSAPYRFGYCRYEDSSIGYILVLYYSDSSFTVDKVGSFLRFSKGSSPLNRLTYQSKQSNWRTESVSSSAVVSSSNMGSPYPYSTNLSSYPSFSPTFVYSFTTPQAGKTYFNDFMPFYFPELPYGYFDGHINSIDGSFVLDLGQVQGTTNMSGVSVSGDTSSGGSTFTDSGYLGVWLQDDNGTYRGYVNMDHGEQMRSEVSTVGTYSGSVSGSSSTSLSGDAPLKYIPTFGETARFRTWAVVSASSYCYFLCDTRNIITGSLESVNDDKGKFRFSAVGSNGVHYPFICIEFASDGTKLQTLAALPNGFTVNFKGGTLSQDSDTGVCSVDPLYHGFWLSDSCPSVDLSSLTDETYKWLANPVFGEAAFTLNFLNAINESINSLNQSVTSSISNQTSTFQNMDAPSNFDPTDVNNMLQYGTLESDFQAPSTDDIFSVDSGTFTDGMGFWRDRMNELLFFSGSPALPMTIFSLTLGLAVLIIGRRVSGGGAA